MLPNANRHREVNFAGRARVPTWRSRCCRDTITHNGHQNSIYSSAASRRGILAWAVKRVRPTFVQVLRLTFGQKLVPQPGVAAEALFLCETRRLVLPLQQMDMDTSMTTLRAPMGQRGAQGARPPVGGFGSGCGAVHGSSSARVPRASVVCVLVAVKVQK
jgi:hypothetical protein